MAASGVGLAGVIAGSAAISMVGNAANQVISHKGLSHFDTGDMVMDGIVGGATGALGGAGKGTKSLMRLGKQTVKRATNTLKYKGVRAVVDDLPKIAAYYEKNTKNFFAGLRAGLRKDIIISTVESVFTSDRSKNQYKAMLGW